MTMQPVRRPGVVTFIGVILYIQAVLAAVAALMLLAFQTRIRDTLETQTGNTFSSASLTGTGIGEAVIAVLLFIVASGIMRGSRGIRAFVAVVEGIRMAAALWAMLFQGGGAFEQSGVVTLLVGAFVLWALYGDHKSHEYFESTA